MRSKFETSARLFLLCCYYSIFFPLKCFQGYFLNSAQVSSWMQKKKKNVVLIFSSPKWGFSNSIFTHNHTVLAHHTKSNKVKMTFSVKRKMDRFHCDFFLVCYDPFLVIIQSKNVNMRGLSFLQMAAMNFGVLVYWCGLSRITILQLPQQLHPVLEKWWHRAPPTSPVTV